MKKQSKGKIGAKRQNLAIVWLKIYQSADKTYIRVETKYTVDLNIAFKIMFNAKNRGVVTPPTNSE